MPLADAELTLGIPRGCNQAYRRAETGRQQQTALSACRASAGSGGPFVVNPTQDRQICLDCQRGRFLNCSMCAVVICWTFAAGIVITISYILDEQSIE